MPPKRTTNKKDGKTQPLGGPLQQPSDDPANLDDDSEDQAVVDTTNDFDDEMKDKTGASTFTSDIGEARGDSFEPDVGIAQTSGAEESESTDGKGLQSREGNADVDPCASQADSGTSKEESHTPLFPDGRSLINYVVDLNVPLLRTEPRPSAGSGVFVSSSTTTSSQVSGSATHDTQLTGIAGALAVEAQPSGSAARETQLNGAFAEEDQPPNMYDDEFRAWMTDDPLGLVRLVPLVECEATDANPEGLPITTWIPINQYERYQLNGMSGIFHSISRRLAEEAQPPNVSDGECRPVSEGLMALIEAAFAATTAGDQACANSPTGTSENPHSDATSIPKSSEDASRVSELETPEVGGLDEHKPPISSAEVRGKVDPDSSNPHSRGNVPVDVNLPADPHEKVHPSLLSEELKKSSDFKLSSDDNGSVDSNTSSETNELVGSNPSVTAKEQVVPNSTYEENEQVVPEQKNGTHESRGTANPNQTSAHGVIYDQPGAQNGHKVVVFSDVSSEEETEQPDAPVDSHLPGDNEPLEDNGANGFLSGEHPNGNHQLPVSDVMTEAGGRVSDEDESSSVEYADLEPDHEMESQLSEEEIDNMFVVMEANIEEYDDEEHMLLTGKGYTLGYQGKYIRAYIPKPEGSHLKSRGSKSSGRKDYESTNEESISIEVYNPDSKSDESKYPDPEESDSKNDRSKSPEPEGSDSKSDGSKSPEESDSKSDGKKSPEDSDSKSDGSKSPEPEESDSKSDGSNSSEESKSKSDGKKSSEDSDSKSDGSKSSEPEESDSKSDGSNSSEESESKSDGKISPEDSDSKSDASKSPEESDSKSDGKKSPQDSDSRSDGTKSPEPEVIVHSVDHRNHEAVAEPLVSDGMVDREEPEGEANSQAPDEPTAVVVHQVPEAIPDPLAPDAVVDDEEPECDEYHQALVNIVDPEEPGAVAGHQMPECDADPQAPVGIVDPEEPEPVPVLQVPEAIADPLVPNAIVNLEEPASVVGVSHVIQSPSASDTMVEPEDAVCPLVPETIPGTSAACAMVNPEEPEAIVNPLVPEAIPGPSADDAMVVPYDPEAVEGPLVPEHLNPQVLLLAADRIRNALVPGRARRHIDYQRGPGPFVLEEPREREIVPRDDESDDSSVGDPPPPPRRPEQDFMIPWIDFIPVEDMILQPDVDDGDRGAERFNEAVPYDAAVIRNVLVPMAAPENQGILVPYVHPNRRRIFVHLPSITLRHHEFVTANVEMCERYSLIQNLTNGWARRTVDFGGPCRNFLDLCTARYFQLAERGDPLISDAGVRLTMIAGVLTDCDMIIHRNRYILEYVASFSDWIREMYQNYVFAGRNIEADNFFPERFEELNDYLDRAQANIFLYPTYVEAFAEFRVILEALLFTPQPQ